MFAGGLPQGGNRRMLSEDIPTVNELTYLVQYVV